ncbi:hypothetical protein CN151_12895 [Sinorhizobium meliloti]|nr:hypothetical protein CN235_13480 [Sinorhizobium meliloti]RVG00852.1 hypothetical protein CN232_12030 [Sinorhizobium meliloti]RVG07581.1 hypothetical protein CN234_19355 [Sinorhizobium meliloti]RVG38320.1 hypothetical protein CN233_04140 [Sinorhizobium meliloti]RVG41510.1 hypothetical protein CN226_35805 [Sinorhizobium meliloti]
MALTRLDVGDLGWLHDLTGQGSPLTLTLSPPAGRGDLRGRGIPLLPVRTGRRSRQRDEGQACPQPLCIATAQRRSIRSLAAC